MIALILNNFGLFWASMIFCGVLSGILFACMFIVDAFIVSFMAPIAIPLITYETKQFLNSIPFSKIFAILVSPIEPFALPMCMLIENIKSLNKDEIIPPHVGWVNTQDVPNPLEVIVFKASARRGKGMDPELAQLIKTFFNRKYSRDEIASMKQLSVQKVLFPEVYDARQLFDFYAPFHVCSLAHVDCDVIITVLDAILQTKSLTAKEAENIRDSVAFMNKATKYFINEIVGNVYQMNIGPCLTPAMIRQVLVYLWKKYEFSQPYVHQGVQGLNQCTLDQLASVLKFHPYPISFGLNYSESHLYNMVKERFNKFVTQYMEKVASEIDSFKTKYNNILEADDTIAYDNPTYIATGRKFNDI